MKKTKILGIKGLQIVSGGQTTASIHRAIYLDKSDFDINDLNMQVKITVVPKTNLKKLFH